jgi:hypothetical protein
MHAQGSYLKIIQIKNQQRSIDWRFTDSRSYSNKIKTLRIKRCKSARSWSYSWIIYNWVWTDAERFWVSMSKNIREWEWVLQDVERYIEESKIIIKSRQDKKRVNVRDNIDINREDLR